MRFIVSLALLIQLADVAGSGSVCTGPPASQDTPSPVSLWQSTARNGGSSLAPSVRSAQDLSNAEDISNAKVPQVEPGAMAGKPYLHRAPHVISDSEIESAIRAAFDQPQS